MSEKFELELEVEDSAIDRGIRKLQEYDRLVKRVSGSVRQATGNITRGGGGGTGGGSGGGGGTGGFGELVGSLGGMSVVERLQQRKRDRQEGLTGVPARGTSASDANQQVQSRRDALRSHLRERNQRITSRESTRAGGIGLNQAGMLGGSEVGERAQRRIQSARQIEAAKRSTRPIRTASSSRSLLGQQGSGFARTRATQLAEGLGRGGFSGARFGRSAVAGLTRRGGAMIGATIGAKLGSVIPGLGTIVGLSIGAGIGALADRAIGSVIDSDSDRLTGRQMRKQIAELSDIRLRNATGPVADFIQQMSTRELRERDVAVDMMRRGESGFRLFGDLFSYQGHGFIGPGWSRRDFNVAREQQQRELTNRRTGGTSSLAPGSTEMQIQLMEQQIARMTRE